MRGGLSGRPRRRLRRRRHTPRKWPSRRGHPPPVLIEAARHAELLVVGSHGHGAFAGMLLEPVSRHCVQHAVCAVLVAR
ncbi:universal stress protein [Streptomyces hyaluromycini]|uniref:universal stress protein n=1 Tax=Streptomyces hyaluromycini TaxID=1377993 RepID=UPI000B5C44EE